MSSVQSVNIQPVAVPDSMPTQSGLEPPAAAISSTSAWNSSKVVGTVVAVGLEAGRLVEHDALEVGLDRHAVSARRRR